MSVRKSLHPLQPIAGDKEILVGRITPAGKDNLKASLRETNENVQKSIAVATPEGKVPSSKRKKLLSKSVQVEEPKPVVTAEDLTTTGEPSSGYWKLLAEERRLALEDALAENEMLHDKIERLEEENRLYKEQLQETENLVEILKDIVNDPADDSQDNINHSVYD